MLPVVSEVVINISISTREEELADDCPIRYDAISRCGVTIENRKEKSLSV
ncbi:MAG TPA: hypothetical protein PLY62_05185 [Bacteroidales bacterium]|jgi:hypothetical protein|nr:hypothetical protein [Bacteroidales bacterium]